MVILAGRAGSCQTLPGRMTPQDDIAAMTNPTSDTIQNALGMVVAVIPGSDGTSHERAASQPPVGVPGRRRIQARAPARAPPLPSPCTSSTQAAMSLIVWSDMSLRLQWLDPEHRVVSRVWERCEELARPPTHVLAIGGHDSVVLVATDLDRSERLVRPALL
jgi:hypothetical protein